MREAPGLATFCCPSMSLATGQAAPEQLHTERVDMGFAHQHFQVGAGGRAL